MGKVVWFTGLSASGKTTVAMALKAALSLEGKSASVLDGDKIRATSHKHLGFSRNDIRENNRLIAESAKKELEFYDFVLVPVISPYRQDRATAKHIIGTDFVELYLNCPLDICIKRDPKGLYKKALTGEIDNFVGISESNPYEVPLDPDFEVMTGNSNIDDCINAILAFLEKM